MSRPWSPISETIRPSAVGSSTCVTSPTARQQKPGSSTRRIMTRSTGLPNRIVILEQADLMLGRCVDGDKQLAVFFIDLDNFKDVNDSLGHEAGDEVLRVVAERLSARLRDSEVVGRMGGDEFVVLAESTRQSDPTTAIAKRLRAVLAEPIRILGREGPLIHVTASIGVAQGVPDSANELLRNADMALYQAKLAGRDCWVSFVPEMKSSALQEPPAAVGTDLGDRGGAVPAPLPADCRPAQRSGRRRRGAHSLGASRARRDLPGPVHTRPRADGPDHRCRSLGTQRGMPPGRSLVVRQSADRRDGQRVGTSARRRKIRR